MPQQITKLMGIPPRKQNAVYWGPGVPDGTGGYAYGTPTEIKCRWDDVAERFITPDGTEETSRSIVYPDRVLENNGYLYLGSISDLDSSAVDPLTVEDAFEIRSTKRIPDFRQKEILYIAML